MYLIDRTEAIERLDKVRREQVGTVSELNINYGIYLAIQELGRMERSECKNISEAHESDGFECSECGLIIEDWNRTVIDEDGDYSYPEYELKYCPNCGRKIV